MPPLTKVSLLSLALFLSGLFGGTAQALIIISITDDGSDLTMTATGSYDFTGTASAAAPDYVPEGAYLAPQSGVEIYGWSGGLGAVAPATIFPVVKSGILTSDPGAITTTDIETTFPMIFLLNAASNYVQVVDTAPLSGTVNESALFSGETLASLGMVAGQSITVTWDGDNLDPTMRMAIIQTSPIPEPTSAVLLGSLALGLLARRRCLG